MNMHQHHDPPLVYQNDFLSVVIQSLPDQPSGSYLCCFSINISRFDLLSKGTYGICSNPAFKGLQLLRAEVSAFALGHGARPRSTTEQACADLSPHGHGWYHESLVIEQVSDTLKKELLQFSVMTLTHKVLSVCRPTKALPQELLDSKALQAFIESLEQE